MASSYVKNPGDRKDYAVDWRPELAAHDGDAIASSTWTVETGLTQATPAPSTAGGISTIWLSGGTLDEDYTVTNTVVTTGGRTYVRSFEVLVRTT